MPKYKINNAILNIYLTITTTTLHATLWYVVDRCISQSPGSRMQINLGHGIHMMIDMHLRTRVLVDRDMNEKKRDE